MCLYCEQPESQGERPPNPNGLPQSYPKWSAGEKDPQLLLRLQSLNVSQKKRSTLKFQYSQIMGETHTIFSEPKLTHMHGQSWISRGKNWHINVPDLLTKHMNLVYTIDQPITYSLIVSKTKISSIFLDLQK